MDAIKELGQYVLLYIEVSPNSSNFSIGKYNSWRKTLEINIKAPPTKGKANKEIIKEFSKLTGCKVELISGMKNTKKVLKIFGIKKRELMNILNINQQA